MFEILSSKIETDEMEIVSEYDVLLFDQQPILFVGKNKDGRRIIGSSVDEDYSKSLERYFHIIVSDSDYDDFRAQKNTYRDLLAKSEPIYVIDYYKKRIEIYLIKFADIPEGYIPTEQSFCPE